MDSNCQREPLSGNSEHTQWKHSVKHSVETVCGKSLWKRSVAKVCGNTQGKHSVETLSGNTQWKHLKDAQETLENKHTHTHTRTPATHTHTHTHTRKTQWKDVRPTQSE